MKLAGKPGVESWGPVLKSSSIVPQCAGWVPDLNIYAQGGETLF